MPSTFQNIPDFGYQFSLSPCCLNGSDILTYLTVWYTSIKQSINAKTDKIKQLFAVEL